MDEAKPIRIKVADTASQEILVTGFVGSIKNATIKAATFNDTLSGEECFLDLQTPTRYTSGAPSTQASCSTP